MDEAAIPVASIHANNDPARNLAMHRSPDDNPGRPIAANVAACLDISDLSVCDEVTNVDVAAPGDQLFFPMSLLRLHL
jgi:hypothetical protein